MPELAEVEFFRKRWAAAEGQRVAHVTFNPRAKVFRGLDPTGLATLKGARLQTSAAAAKQMLFRFSGGQSLGVHLGMTGETCIGSVDTKPGAHDHLVLTLEKVALVFHDPRMFGRILYHRGPGEPEWWTSLPPALLDDAFTVEALAQFLTRHRKSPLKALLLDQTRFPGIGNWMADEILWRSALHPRRGGGTLTETEIATLHREIRWVCREALATIGETLDDPPETWLFPHRWRDGGRCPRTGVELVRETIGGRTSCWSPGRQTLAKAESGPRRPAKRV